MATVNCLVTNIVQNIFFLTTYDVLNDLEEILNPLTSIVFSFILCKSMATVNCFLLPNVLQNIFFLTMIDLLDDL